MQQQHYQPNKQEESHIIMRKTYLCNNNTINPTNMKKILFIIGSLRKQSFNREISEMVKDLLKGKAEVTELDYSQVPFINQDDEYPAPQAVADARKAVAEADGVWIFSPEYNYSYPGHVLTTLLTVLKADVMTEGQTGIVLNLEAWTEGRMILTEEQKAQLAKQAELFLEFIK